MKFLAAILAGLRFAWGAAGSISLLWSWLPTLGTLSGLLGPVGPFVVASITFVGRCIGWIMDDIVEVLAKPTRLILSLVFLAGGLYLGLEMRKAQVVKRDSTIAAMKQERIQANAEADQRERLAKAARAEAEKRVADSIEALRRAGLGPDGKRVQPVVVRRANPAPGGGSGLFGFPALFQGPK